MKLVFKTFCNLLNLESARLAKLALIVLTNDQSLDIHVLAILQRLSVSIKLFVI